MRFGYTYTTELPPDVVAKCIREQSSGLGFTVIDSFDHDGSIRLFSSGLNALIRQLPGRVTWHVSGKHGTTTIYLDSRPSPTTTIAILLLCILAPVLMRQAASFVSSQVSADISGSLYLGILAFLASMLLLPANYELLLSGTERYPARIIERLRRTSMESGTFLAERGQSTSARHLLYTGLYLCFVFTFTSYVALHIVPPVLSDMPFGSATIVTLMISLLAVLLLLLVLCLRSPGLSRRSVALYAGPDTAIAVLFLFNVQFAWIAAKVYITPQRIEAITAYQAACSASSSSSMRLSQIRGAMDQTAVRAHDVARVTCLVCIGWGLLFVVIAGKFVGYALRSALRALPYLRQLALHPDIEWSVQATAPLRWMRSFVILWASVWGILSVCNVVAFAEIARSSWEMLFLKVGFASTIAIDARGTVGVSLLLGGVLLDSRESSVLVPFLLRVAWLLYLVACWLLLAMSLGSIAAGDWRLRRCVKSRLSTTGNAAMKCVDSVQRLWGRCSTTAPVPAIAITESRMPFAYAACYGSFHRSMVIGISKRCTEILDEEELDALLAHELAHHRLGHVGWDRWLRLLGRATFVGDAFVRVLQNSFDYEVLADTYAVSEFCVRPKVLKRSLYKVRTVAAIEGLREIVGPGTSFLAEEGQEIARGEGRLSWFEEFRVALRLYLKQYLGVGGWGYWHPSLTRRVAHLDALSVSSTSVS